MWVPVLLVYLLDLQVWYTVLSALLGLFVGLLQHIGEVRDMRFLWLRFLALPAAVSLNFLHSHQRTGQQ